MEIIKTEFEGLCLIKNKIFSDNRGLFVKTVNSDVFSEYSLNSVYAENFYTVSSQGVIRGMHFQIPPFAQDKLVYVVEGAIRDIILDLRKDSATYGKHLVFELNSTNRLSLFIPIGFAHGYEVISEKAITIYHTTTVFSQQHDTGVRWDSFGAEWMTQNPIVSEKDKNFCGFDEYVSPF